MNKKANTEMITLTGIVMPSDWDGKGNIHRVVLSTYKEEEYPVDKRGRGKELLGCLRKKVEVLGVLSGNPGCRKLRVKHYRFLNSDADGKVEP